MSLEGLRAWIGEVERKLGKRTRVFLALAVIAIGLGGAAIYLAIDARDNSVSESDVQELQQQLEAQINAAAVTSPSPTPTEPEPETQPKPEQNGSGGPTGGVGAGGASAGEKGATAPGGAADKAELGKLLEQAEEQKAKAAEGQDGK